MITKQKLEGAKTLYIQSDKYSYGIFCWNKSGDLFVNSDYGMHGYAWRHFGDDFEDFLRRTNAEYIVGKFEYNLRMTTKKGLNKFWKQNLEGLVGEFIQALKELHEERVNEPAI